MMLKNPFLKLFGIFYVFILSLIFVSCGEEKKPTTPNSNKIVIKQEFKDKVANKKTSDEYLLLETSCLYCHTIGAPKEVEVAATMQVIRDAYKQAHPNKEAFIKSFQDFFENPVAENSLIPTAVEQYGSTDETSHVKDDLEDIAGYLFEYQF